MKTYQVTRKLQVTVPKRLATKVGIKPGDSIIFDEANGAIVMKKVSDSKIDPKELKAIIEDFARESVRLKPYVRKARSALIENLSGHVPTQ
ncbi:MAG: AbrB/MazE/SpoVT family DNA-binding domain-containing protein [Thaumarchaeota archaeon]|nr:AbrB/MazE/SpoVT family DNA-binding domain-containing protein [Nitrososphaerota archaeon]